jgi:hypothetical protein
MMARLLHRRIHHRAGGLPVRRLFHHAHRRLAEGAGGVL